MEVDEGEDPAEMLRLAEQFRGLVKTVGGPARAASVLRRSPNTVHSWMSAKTKIPFLVIFRLTQEADLSLDAFAAGEEAVASARTAAPIVSGSAPSEDYVELPRLRVQAAAGAGRFMAPGDDDPGQFLAARSSWLHSIGCSPAKTEALMAKGDSMEPTIRDGDTLLVDRSVDRIVDNGIYVVVVAGAVVVKRLTRRLNGSVVLSSDNPSHPPETVTAAEVNELLIVEGRVRWCGRLM